MAQQDFSLLKSAFLGSESTEQAASPAPAQGGDKVANFVGTYLPLAQRVSEKTGVAPEALLGQWGLETGWGKSVVPGTNNLGNIKDFSGKGTKAVDNMTKTTDAYRQYDTVDDFGDDFAGLLSRRYRTAMNTGGNTQKYFNELKRLGYAEDPNYVTSGVKAAKMVSNVLGTNGGQEPSFSNARPLETDRSIGQALADNLLGAASGVVTGAKLLTDTFGADNRVSQALGDTTKALTDSQSQYRKDQRQERAFEIKNAEASGSTWKEIVANVGGFLEAPVETTLNALGTSAPTLLMSVIPGLGQAGAARLILQGATGAAQGVGAAKSGIYDSVRDELIATGKYSPDDAAKIAAGAQAYDSQNAGNIALNGLLGMVAGTSGIESAAGRLAGRKAGQETARGIAGRAGMGVVKESPVEGTQGGFERYTSNVALNNEGFNVDPMQGVAGQAAGEALASAPGGAVFGAMDRGMPAPAINPLQPVIDQAQKPGSVLSRAVVSTGAADQAVAPQATTVLPDGTPATQTGVDPTQIGSTTGLKGPGASTDPYAQKAAELEQFIRSQDLVRSLRADGGGLDGVMFDLRTLRDPNAREDIKAAAQQRLEEEITWAQTNYSPSSALMPVAQQPGFEPITDTRAPRNERQDVLGLEAVQSTLRDPQVGPKISDTDRQAVLQLTGDAQNPGLPLATRQNAAQQAIEIVGRYRAAMESQAQPVAQPVAPEGQQTVARQTTPAGDGPAIFRRRREAIGQMVDSGYETVERRGNDFFLKNAKTGEELMLTGMADAQIARNKIKQLVDAKAHVAATSPLNDRPEPSQKAADAERYKKGEVIDLNGVEIKIENPEGSFRRGVSPDGVMWETKMVHHYGDIERTKGADEAKIDVFIGPRPDTDKIYVIDQVNEDGSFDEHKVMMGFTSEEAARAGYLANYEKGWTGLGAITEMSPADFKVWAKSPEAKKPLAALPGKAAVAAATAAPTDKARWIKAILDKNRLAGKTGVQLDVTEDGRLNFLGNPTSTKEGQSLVATLQEAKKAGATEKEIADAIRASKPSKPSEPATEGQFATLEDAKRYISQQRRANGTASGLPVQLADGSFGIATKGSPQYAEAERQRDERDAAGAKKQGEFFTVQDAGKPKRVKRVKKSELPKKAASARRPGEPRPLTQEEAGLIEQIASVLGKRVVFFEAQDGRIGDGFFDPMQPDVLFVASETTVNPLAVFGHEFYHDLRETNPEAWNAIAAVVRARVKDPKGFRADYYGNAVAEQRGDAALSEEKGGELEELVSDLGGNLMMDATFWRDVFAKIQEDNGADSKGIIARLAAALEQFVTRVVNAMKQGGFKADDFVSDIEAVRKAYRDGLANYIKASGARQAAVAAEVKKAEQQIKKSTDKQVDKGLTVEGYHFSKEPRSELKTDTYGTGLKGSARDEIMASSDDRIKQRLYFYVDKGTGINPESGVGGYAHKATLTGIYDADADPLRLRGGDARAFESKILDAGFKGYLSRLDGTQSGQVILLGKQTVKPELLGTGKVTGAQVVPAAQKREQDAADRLIANKNLPLGMLTPQAWSEVLMAQDPEFAAQLLDIGAFSGDKAIYKDELAAKVRKLGGEIRKSADRAKSEYDAVVEQYKGTDQWMKAPNGEATKLTERQWVQVRTPAFKAWFGDWEKHARAENPVGSLWSDDNVSKAVGSNGEPLVVYHGSDKGGFTEFEKPSGKGRGDLGIWTTPDYGMARSYVRKGRARDVDLTAPTKSELEDLDFEFNEDDDGVTVIDPNGYTIDGPADNDFKFRSVEDAVAAAIAEFSGEAGAQPGIYALFINVRNPNEDNFEGAMWNGERIDQYQVRDENDEPVYDENGRGYFDQDTAERLVEENPGSEMQPADSHYNTTDDVVREALSSKQDGAIIREVIDDGGGVGYFMDPQDIFVAFDPTQVKSADYNNGEFSDSTGDLRMSPDRKPKRPAQDPAIGDKTDVSKLPEGKVIPESAALGGLEKSLELAGSKSYRRGRELKQDIQDRVLAASKAARVNLSQRTRNTFKFLSNMVVGDAKFALKSNENAVGWYDQKVSRAIGALSTVHPEIESDPRSRLAFLWALAVTSNGMKVGDNFKLAEKAYRFWKANGLMPTDIGVGNAAQGINKGMQSYNELVSKVGDERMLKFMSTPFSAGEIERMLGMKVGGEWKATPVRGAAILGPKIGNGFFSNLNGYFDALTMDRWLMRTWGRMTGTLLKIDQKVINFSRDKLYEAIKAMTPQERRAMGELIGKPVKSSMTKAELDTVAIASQKASMKVDKRKVMMASELTNNFRKAANNHQKAMDGQKEAPAGPAERNWIRAVFQDALEKLQADGVDMTMSDLQALLWYPERRLYDAAKAEDEIDAGYEDDEAPDYANAAFDLAVANGVSKSRVMTAMDAAEARGTVVGKQLSDEEKAAMMEEFRAPPEQQFQIAFEVAPNPDNKAATEQWNSLSQKDRAEITKLVNGAILADLADALGLPIGKAAFATGGYEGQINPNVIAGYKPKQVSIEDARALAAAIGIALDQKSVAIVDSRASEERGLVRITLSKKVDKYAADIMAAITEQIPELESFTARGNNLDIINFTDTPTETLAGKIESVLDGIEADFEAAVSFGDVKSELIKENDYEGQITGSRPESGSEILERAGWARDRAREIVEAELAARLARPVPGRAGNARRADAGSEIRRSVGRDGEGRGQGRSPADRALEASEQADAQEELTALPGAPQVKGFTGPDPRLVAVAQKYAEDNGITLRRQAEYVKVDPERAARIADAYAAMPHDPQSPRVEEAYQNLISQTIAQYKALEDAGYKFWFMDMSRDDNQEYASSPWNAMRDIRANKQMGVFPTADGFGSNDEVEFPGNPLEEATEFKWPKGGLDGPLETVYANDLFRAVHDAFGHGLEGAGFRAEGEENAWQAHIRLFTGSAVAAITSETRGQNSWLNYGPNGETNRMAKVEDTVFADQKTGLMPEWTWKEGVVGDMPGAARSPDRAEPEAETVTELAEVDAKAAAGRKVTYEVEVEESGQIAKLTVDAGTAIEDYDDRIAIINKMLECLRK